MRIPTRPTRLTTWRTSARPIQFSAVDENGRLRSDVDSRPLVLLAPGRRRPSEATQVAVRLVKLYCQPLQAKIGGVRSVQGKSTCPSHEKLLAKRDNDVSGKQSRQEALRPSRCVPGAGRSPPGAASTTAGRLQPAAIAGAPVRERSPSLRMTAPSSRFECRGPQWCPIRIGVASRAPRKLYRFRVIGWVSGTEFATGC